MASIDRTADQKQFSVVITTAADEQSASKLTASILAARLAACVQLQSIKSFYTWKGQQCEESECLLFIKTKRALYPALEQHIKANHSYETPEIVELPIIRGSLQYLNWIEESTK